MSTAQVCECGHAVTMHPDGRIGKRRLDGEWSCLDPYCRCTRTQASFQVVVPPDPDLCACGHGRAMHFDEDGDHNGPCLWQVHKDAPFCKCDMWHRKPSEDEFLGVPVSEWRQIAAEINCRRGPDGSLLKRFRELIEVSDMRAALLKKRSAPSPSPALAALVEAGDAMRKRLTSPWKSVREPDAPHDDGRFTSQIVEAWDRARAALPKGCGA